MNVRCGYRRIVLIVAGLAGVFGLVAGIASVAEQAGEFSGLVGVILCLMLLVLAPSLSFACTGIVLWFGGLGICHLVMWVVYGFDGKPDSHPWMDEHIFGWVVHGFGGKPDSVAGSQTPPWARVKVGNCLRLAAIGLVGISSVIGAGMFLEATAGRDKAAKDTAPPPPVDTLLSEISVDKVELYDCRLDSIGAMSGFIKNASPDMLKEVDAHVIVRNSRKDIIFQGSVTLRCEVPPGEARPFSYGNAVPPQNLPDACNRNFEWTWECYKVAARGPSLTCLEDIPETPKGQKKRTYTTAELDTMEKDRPNQTR